MQTVLESKDRNNVATGRDDKLIWRYADHSDDKCRNWGKITAVDPKFMGEVTTDNGCTFQNPAVANTYPRVRGVFFLMLSVAVSIKPSTFKLPKSFDTKISMRLKLVAQLLIDIKTADKQTGVQNALAPLAGQEMPTGGAFMIQITGAVTASFALMTGNSALDQQLSLSIPVGTAGLRIAIGYGQDDLGYDVEDGLFFVGRAKLSLIDVIKPLGHDFFKFGGKRSIFDLSAHAALGVFIKKTGMGVSFSVKAPFFLIPVFLVQFDFTLFGYWSGPNQGGLFEVGFRVELVLAGEAVGLNLKLGVKWGSGQASFTGEANLQTRTTEEALLQTQTTETAQGAIPFTCDIEFKEFINGITKWVGTIGTKIKDWVMGIFKGEELLQRRLNPDAKTAREVETSNRRMLLQSDSVEAPAEETIEAPGSSYTSDFGDALASHGGSTHEPREQNLDMRSQSHVEARRRRWHRWHVHHRHRPHIHHRHSPHVHHRYHVHHRHHRHHVHHRHHRYHVHHRHSPHVHHRHNPHVHHRYHVHHRHSPHVHHRHSPHIHLKLTDIASVHFKVDTFKMNMRWDGFELSFHASLGAKLFGIGKSGSFNLTLKVSLSSVADALWNAVKKGLDGISKIFSGEELSEDYEAFLQRSAPVSVIICEACHQ